MKQETNLSSSISYLTRNTAAFLGLASLLAFGGSTTDVNGSMITLDQLNQTATLGESVTFDVRISGLAPQETVGYYEFTLHFDPTILEYESIVFGDPVLGDQLSFTEPAGHFVDFNNFGGVFPFGSSLDPASVLEAQQPDSFVLTSITLKTIGLGTSPVSLRSDFFGGPGPDYIPLTNPEVGDMGSVTVTNVPEGGSTAAFLAASIFFLGFVSYKYRRTQSA